MSMAAAQALRTMVAKMEAALTLTCHQETVVRGAVQDITSQPEVKSFSYLTVVSQYLSKSASVNEMVTAVRSRLLGNGASGPIRPEEAKEALVWGEAAAVLGSKAAKEARLSVTAAEMLREAFGEVEAACKLSSNRERVVQDITNPGLTGIGGGFLTQAGLKRVNYVHRASVDAMVSEMCSRLFGKKTNSPSTSAEAQVWADAALFFHHRIQASAAECPGRNADMSQHAAKALRKVLSQIANQPENLEASNLEAAQMLMFNRERVVQDITNPGPENIDGKTLTQTDLQRVDPKQIVLVDAMVNEVCCCLLGRATSKPPSPEDALVWAEAAKFLAGRIQGKREEMKGRNPDMSSGAAAALRTMLAQMEAAHTLMNNRERVVLDITNPGPENIDGKKLTQTNLTRVDAEYRSSVDAMVREVCRRLLGKGATELQVTPEEMPVWAKAARFLSGRIQGAPADCLGRSPDMSSAAAAALRSMLAQLEPAPTLLNNSDSVVPPITTPRPKNIDVKTPTQTSPAPRQANLTATILSPTQTDPTVR
jgi:hypothetical protein